MADDDDVNNDPLFTSLLVVITNSSYPRKNLFGIMKSLGSVSSKTSEGLSKLTYQEHITTTLVILFYLFLLPVAGVMLVLLWRIYLKACENCERSLSRKQSVIFNMVDMQDFRLRHDCCKKNVAPILFPLPADFNFKHSCGSKCKGPKVWQPD